MNYEVVDILYRSRKTLLDHLEESGYITEPYRKIAHTELDQMVRAGPVAGAPPALQMDLQRRDDSKETIRKCVVVTTLGRIKAKLKAFTEKLFDPEETDFDPSTTELIVVTFEPIVATFHSMAFECWTKHSVRIRYFQAEALVNNPLKHILVPLHERVPKEEETALLQGLYAKKTQFPLIRFHEDPIARMLGTLPGELLKITRPSPTAGKYITYRVCVP
jgi:DNA-directed RNA polymerase I, II, and III subunit RPABC1